MLGELISYNVGVLVIHYIIIYFIDLELTLFQAVPTMPLLYSYVAVTILIGVYHPKYGEAIWSIRKTDHPSSGNNIPQRSSGIGSKKIPSKVITDDHQSTLTTNGAFSKAYDNVILANEDKTSKTDDNVISKADDDVISKADEGVFSKADDGVISQVDDGVITKADDGVITKADDGVITKADDGVMSKADDGVISKADDGVIYKADDGVITKADDGVITKADDGVITKADDGVITKADDGVMSKADGVISKADDGVISKADDGVISKADDNIISKANGGINFKAYDDVISEANADDISKADDAVISNADDKAQGTATGERKHLHESQILAANRKHHRGHRRRSQNRNTNDSKHDFDVEEETSENDELLPDIDIDKDEIKWNGQPRRICNMVFETNILTEAVNNYGEKVQIAPIDGIDGNKTGLQVHEMYCEKERVRCTAIDRSVYRSTCKTQYRYNYAPTISNGNFEISLIKIRSGCNCIILKKKRAMTFNILDYFGWH